MEKIDCTSTLTYLYSLAHRKHSFPNPQPYVQNLKYIPLKLSSLCQHFTTIHNICDWGLFSLSLSLSLSLLRLLVLKVTDRTCMTMCSCAVDRDNSILLPVMHCNNQNDRRIIKTEGLEYIVVVAEFCQ